MPCSSAVSAPWTSSRQDRTQLCSGQAGADDGTVQAMVEIPDPRPLPRCLLNRKPRTPARQQPTDLAHLLDRVRQNGRQNGTATRHRIRYILLDITTVAHSACPEKGVVSRVAGSHYNRRICRHQE